MIHAITKKNTDNISSHDTQKDSWVEIIKFCKTVYLGLIDQHNNLQKILLQSRMKGKNDKSSLQRRSFTENLNNLESIQEVCNWLACITISTTQKIRILYGRNFCYAHLKISLTLWRLRLHGENPDYQKWSWSTLYFIRTVFALKILETVKRDI